MKGVWTFRDAEKTTRYSIVVSARLLSNLIAKGWMFFAKHRNVQERFVPVQLSIEGYGRIRVIMFCAASENSRCEAVAVNDPFVPLDYMVTGCC